MTENNELEKIVNAIFKVYPTNEAVHLVTELIKVLNEVRAYIPPPERPHISRYPSSTCNEK